MTPSSAPLTLLDDDANWLKQLKSDIARAQQRAALAVNAELVQLYWRIGRDILLRQDAQGRTLLLFVPMRMKRWGDRYAGGFRPYADETAGTTNTASSDAEGVGACASVVAGVGVGEGWLHEGTGEAGEAGWLVCVSGFAVDA